MGSLVRTPGYDYTHQPEWIAQRSDLDADEIDLLARQTNGPIQRIRLVHLVVVV